METTIQKHQEKTLEEIRMQNHPFDDDLLGRKEIAGHLTQIIKNTKSPFVFNINAPYGTGKTFFLSRLKILLEKDKCAAVLYNSWETDWANDPFVAILEELSEEIDRLSKLKDSFITDAAEKALKEAFKYVYSAVIGLGKEIIKYCPPAESIINATETALEHKNGTEPDSQYHKVKEAKKHLKELLTGFTAKLEKPLVIIIDELDRCRPDYAVRTLEAIKHFFNIPNIVFVLAIDRQQIESAVSVLYGKKIETHSAEYLRKFIDYDFYLPSPDSQKFLNMLLELHIRELIQPFCQRKMILMSIKAEYCSVNLENNVITHINSILYRLSQFFSFSLRAQEQIIIKMRMFVSALSDKDYLMPELLVWNVCLYAFDNELYHKFKYKRTSSYILVPNDYLSEDLDNKELNHDAINSLLNPEKNTTISLSIPLNKWIDDLINYNPSIIHEGNLWMPSSKKSVQKYLDLTPLI